MKIQEITGKLLTADEFPNDLLNFLARAKEIIKNKGIKVNEVTVSDTNIGFLNDDEYTMLLQDYNDKILLKMTGGKNNNVRKIILYIFVFILLVIIIIAIITLIRHYNLIPISVCNHR